MSAKLEKCVDFKSDMEKGQEAGMTVSISNVRESIDSVFNQITFDLQPEQDYPFHVYSLIYNLHVLENGDNGRFDWKFLPEISKVELLESVSLSDSIKIVADDVAEIKAKFGQFPVTYQVHPFHDFKCPQEIAKCYSDYNPTLGSYMVAQPAMEELLVNTYKLSAVMRNDLNVLSKNECFTDQLMQAYFQDVTARGKLICAEIYSKASHKASNDPAFENIKETIDTACKVFDSTPTWFDEQYICKLRPTGCADTHEVGIDGSTN